MIKLSKKEYNKVKNIGENLLLSEKEVENEIFGRNKYDGIIRMLSGVDVNLKKPTPDVIHINDIAASLSKICRFSGHITDFFSVAQHSLLVCALCPDNLKKVGLLHDATEAYLNDCISPLKVILAPLYGPLEESFHKAIFTKFGLSMEDLDKIKEFDIEALRLEHLAFQENNEEAFYEILDLIDPFFEYSNEKFLGMFDFWKDMFLEKFDELFNI